MFHGDGSLWQFLQETVVDHPAMTAVLVGFPDNVPHVDKEVDDVPGVAPCQHGGVGSEAGDSGE